MYVVGSQPVPAYPYHVIERPTLPALPTLPPGKMWFLVKHFWPFISLRFFCFQLITNSVFIYEIPTFLTSTWLSPHIFVSRSNNLCSSRNYFDRFNNVFISDRSTYLYT